MKERKIHKSKRLNSSEPTQEENKYHKQSLQEFTLSLKTSLIDGLDKKNAEERLKGNGANLIKYSKNNILKKIFRHFFSGFCGLLWISSIVCILAWKPIGRPPDPTDLGLGILLIIVVFLQAAFSAFQDWSSGRVMKSIKNMMPSSALVIRNGSESKIPVEEVVVGDLVLLTYGNKVPADCRIIESHDLKFDKSMLTGESEAIEGTTECTDERYVESKNIAFMTTLITNGQGKAIVVSTGDNTIMGKIANLTCSSSQIPTSLQKEISRFVVLIASLAVLTVIILVIFWLFWLRVYYPSYINTPSMMVICIAVLVGFIPTGLPVAVTLSLLTMARKMAKNRVLVKDLTTIETLSCVNIIASDKTGTLTQNKMFVADIYAGETSYEVGKALDSKDNSAFEQLITASLLCNNSSFIDDGSMEENHQIPLDLRKANGDATDIALLRLATLYNTIENLRSFYVTLVDVPFNSANKWMIKILVPNDKDIHGKAFKNYCLSNIMLIKGAPDKILYKCSSILQKDGSIKNLDEITRLNIIAYQNDLCLKGERVLIICKKDISDEDLTKICLENSDEIKNFLNESKGFCIIGMVGIIDPPREGMRDVIQKCRGAGIRVLMVTGDYAVTAAAIAKEIGIFSTLNYDTMFELKDKSNWIDYFFTQKNSLLLNGSDVELLTAKDWRLVTSYEEIVFARTTPEQKLKIVNEFQNDGFTVGATGDGVNDAPALKNADIGIAMGSGSEVAIEASKIVLLDNSFHSILIAIENGRLVFNNLRKVILYLLPAGSIGEITPILVHIFLGVPLPLSPFLMICICILTDMSPALALMMEKPEKNLLTQPPRSKKNHLVDWKLLIQAYLFIGLMEAFFAHLAFFIYIDWYAKIPPQHILFVFDKWKHGYKNYTIHQLNEFVFTGQTVFFITLVMMQVFGNVLAIRTNYKSLFETFPLRRKSKNFWIFISQIVSLVFMILIVFLPLCHTFFNTRNVPVPFFFIPFIFALFIIAADEMRKIAVRKKIFSFQRIAW